MQTCAPVIFASRDTAVIVFVGILKKGTKVESLRPKSISGAMMMKLPLRISRMSSREFPWRSIEFPPKRLRHSIIFLLKKGLYILWKNPEVRGQPLSFASALKIMLPSIPMKCMFTNMRGCLSLRSTSERTSIISASCFLLPSQIMLFSTKLRPSSRQCCFLS